MRTCVNQPTNVQIYLTRRIKDVLKTVWFLCACVDAHNLHLFSAVEGLGSIWESDDSSIYFFVPNMKPVYIFVWIHAGFWEASALGLLIIDKWKTSLLQDSALLLLYSDKIDWHICVVIGGGVSVQLLFFSINNDIVSGKIFFSKFVKLLLRSSNNKLVNIL